MIENNSNDIKELFVIVGKTFFSITKGIEYYITMMEGAISFVKVISDNLKDKAINVLNGLKNTLKYGYVFDHSKEELLALIEILKIAADMQIKGEDEKTFFKFLAEVVKELIKNNDITRIK